MVLPKNGKNFIGRICKQRRSLEEKRNKKENYTYYQKWTAKITGEYNEGRSIKELKNDGTREKQEK